MIEQGLLLLGASTFALLGTIHLIFTFVGARFEPRDLKLMESMKVVSPRISGQTTMWAAWIGFNASHSLGAMTFAFLYLYLGLFHYELLQQSRVLNGFPVVVGLVFVGLAKLYWFKVPLLGISFATVCFCASFLMSVM